MFMVNKVLCDKPRYTADSVSIVQDCHVNHARVGVSKAVKKQRLEAILYSFLDRVITDYGC